jgi:hypothetical protein
MDLKKLRILMAILCIPYSGIFIAGCAHHIKDVPFTVNSRPPGSYVLLQTLIPDKNMYDWVYLGTTPVAFEREMDFKQLKKAESISLKILKEGYFEQTKSWSSDDFIDLYDDKGGISWDPHLVPMGDK